MRHVTTVAALAALISGAVVLEASAGDGCCRHRRAHLYAPPPYAVPVNPWAAWRAYYSAQAEVSFARRAGRANWFAATGRAVPSRYFGPPTNAYAERYALDPYSYFTCPLARRGDGICAGQPPLSATADAAAP
jgi:hypothetical protein